MVTGGMDPMIGRTLSHYRVLEKIGAGGMGVVYRARDEHLHRDVALKVLPPDALEDDEARRRFRKEALALSKLNHAHICTVHDFDTAQGVDFLVMEHVEGETLAARLRPAALPEAEVIRLGQQVADALEAAHERGVIHRDLKPGNIMVTPKGNAKVLDFGLAKQRRPAGAATTVSFTGTPEVRGTLPYMAPEQLLGGTIDARTDVHALGAVLYEMATGRPPFDPDSAIALSGAILHQAPVAPRKRNPAVSRGLEAIILRCLEKEPQRRFPSAHGVAEALRRHAEGSGLADLLRHAVRTHRRFLATAAVALAIGVPILWLTGGLGWSRGCGAPPARTLAVLPLVNLSGDPAQEYLADGITEELITALAQVRALRVTAPTSIMSYKGRSKPLPAIAKELGVDLIAQGSVQRTEHQVRVAVRLIEPRANRLLWSRSFSRSAEQVLALQSDVAQAIVSEIRVRLSAGERRRFEAPPSIDARAMDAYLRGRHQFSRGGGDVDRAITSFNEAIEIAPTFAPAYSGLASAYIAISGAAMTASEACPRAKALAERAIALDPGLAEAHAALGAVRAFYEWNWSDAEVDFLKAIDLNSSDVFSRTMYTWFLVTQGRFDEADGQIVRARALDPISNDVAAMSFWPLYEGRRAAEALQRARALVQSDPEHRMYFGVYLGQAYLLGGDLERASREFASIVERGDRSPLVLSYAAYAHGRAGRVGEAERILRELTARGESEYVQPYWLAIIQVGMGNKDRALRHLEETVDQHSAEATFLKVDPTLDPLRGEPRFQALLRRMRLAP